MIIFKEITGWWRCKVWNLCPECNSDAPKLYSCSVCCHNEFKGRSVLWERFIRVDNHTCSIFHRCYKDFDKVDLIWWGEILDQLDEGDYHFKCRRCDDESYWDFTSTPAPFSISKEEYNHRKIATKK